nr:hypothetical protein [Tanacetum cinerariifolium]
GSDRGLKKRKTSKDVEPPKGSKSKESKSSSSKGSMSQSKSSGKSAQAEDHLIDVDTSDSIVSTALGASATGIRETAMVGGLKYSSNMG